MRITTFILVIWLLIVAIAVWTAGRAQSATFDYYLLSMAWSPTFCLEHPRDVECQKPHGFILHGLWPQYEDGGYPRNCSFSRLPNDIVEDMLPLMPSRRLIYHEWTKHGTCTGLEPRIFFETARSAFASITVPEIFNRPQSFAIAPQAIVEAFKNVNQDLKDDEIRISCQDGKLNEVRICMDVDGHARSCGAMPDACPMDRIYVPKS